MDEDCDDTLVKLDTNVMIDRTADGHGTVRDMTFVTICKWVRRVRLIVECSPFFDPDAFIFKAINTTKKMTAQKAATIINAVETPLDPHLSHRFSEVGTNPELHVEQRRFKLDGPLKPNSCAHDSL
jgi:hypothetical protein